MTRKSVAKFDGRCLPFILWVRQGFCRDSCYSVFGEGHVLRSQVSQIYLEIRRILLT